jgi:hypothetical protein
MPRIPSKDEIKDIAYRVNIHLTDEDLDAIQRVFGLLMISYDAFVRRIQDPGGDLALMRTGSAP